MRAFLVPLSLSLCLGACGGPAADHSTHPAPPAWPAPPFFANIPADTPYVFATIDPPNDALRERINRGISSRLAKSLAATDALVKDEDEPWKRAVATVIDTLRGTNLDKWNETLGLAPSPRVAIYGLGVFPVLRTEVVDAVKLRAVVTKAMAAAGNVTTAALGGIAYWTFDFPGGPTFVLSVKDKEAVAAIVPKPQLAQLLPLVLGIAHPPRSLADTTEVPAMLQKYGFNRSAFAEVDTAALGAAIATLPDSPVSAPGCKDDLARIASYLPRMMIGYRRFDTAGFGMGVVFETSPGVADVLGRVRAALPKLPRDADPMLEMSAGVDVDAFVDAVRTGVHALRNQPFHCPAFAGAAEHLDELGRALDTPLPAEVRGLRGVDVVVDDVVTQPPSGKGGVIVVGASARALLAMLFHQVPLGLQMPPDDGSPIELPISAVFSGVTAYVAARTDAAALAVGDATAGDRVKDRVIKALVAAPDPHAPLVWFTWDIARMMERVPEAFRDPSLTALRGMKRMDMSLDLRDRAIDIELDSGWP